MNIVVAGYVASFPIAGFFWHAMSFAIGFRSLGHDVWFLEDSGDYPRGWDLEKNEEDPQCRAGIEFLRREMAEVGFDGRWSFRHFPSGRYDGMSEAATLEALDAAEVFVNVSCTTPMRPEYMRIPNRLAIDTDPVFTQIRIASGNPALAQVPDTHTRLFTFGRPPLPAQEHEWVPTRQPVAVELWPLPPPPDSQAPFTTVTTWRAYAPVSWAGRRYGGKDRSFSPYLNLPSRTPLRLQVALGGGEDGKLGGELLSANGWEVIDSRAASKSSAGYREFLGSSRGEFALAKHAYVSANCGWFSERTCCYLALGRPAVIQDTGFSRWIPVGKGVLPFSNPVEAVEALEAADSEWELHSKAARALVEEHFSAERVCQDILEAVE